LATFARFAPYLKDKTKGNPYLLTAKVAKMVPPTVPQVPFRFPNVGRGGHDAPGSSRGNIETIFFNMAV